jgi:hypothetical protein
VLGFTHYAGAAGTLVLLLFRFATRKRPQLASAHVTRICLRVVLKHW